MTVKLEEGKVWGFLKFTKYWEELLDGQIYMNRLGYYLDEEKHGIGLGDANEGSLVLNHGTLEMTEIETGKSLEAVKIENVKITNPTVLEKPVYCLLGLDHNMLKFYEETDTDYIFKIKGEHIEKLISDFGTNEVVYLNPGQFMMRLTEKLNKDDVYFECREVMYSDYAVNYTDRVTSGFKSFEEACFWKDVTYKHQNEWRLMVSGTKNITSPYIIELGDLRDIAVKTTIESLAEKMKFSFPKGKQ